MTERSFHYEPGRHRLTLDGESVPSVTTIKKACFPKAEVLQNWASRTVAEFAYDHRDTFKDLPREAAVDLLKREPMRFTGKRARRGTAVHAAIAYYNAMGEPPDDLTDEEYGFYNAALLYLTEHDVEVIESEVTVWSREHHYGGTLDLIQRRNGDLEIADFKSSKAIYSDVALQLVAYARAEFIGRQDGTEDPLPEVVRGVAVHLRGDGTYEALPVLLDDNVFAVFRAARAIFEWDRGLSRRVLQPALRAA